MDKKALYKDNTLWLSESLLVQAGISRAYLKQAARYRNRAGNKSWRYCQLMGSFYYDYVSIPDKAPAYLRSKLPSFDECMSCAMQENLYVRESEKTYYSKLILDTLYIYENNQEITYYMCDSTPRFPQNIAEQMSRALAWCRMMTDYLDNNKYKQLGINKKKDYMQFCFYLIAKEDIEGLQVSTLASLRKKLYYFPKTGQNEQRNYLISKHFGNDNARVVGKYQVVHPETGEIMRYDAHEAVIYESWMNPHKSNKRTKYDLYHNEYRIEMESSGIDPVEYRTFCSYITRISNRAIMSKERDGGKHFNDKYKPYVPCRPLEYALSLVAADGSGTKLAYQYQDKLGLTKRATLYLVRITDVASRYIMGYAIGDHETPEMVRQALSQAVRSSGNREFLDLITDNGSAFNNKESKRLIRMISRQSRTITPGNSQENPAELHVRLLTQFSRKMENWIYSGFNAHHIDHTANPDYFAKNENLPSYEEAVEQVIILINEWNNTPWQGKTPSERFANKNPKSGVLDEKVLRYCFGYKTIVNIAYMRGFVVCYKEIGGQRQKFSFDIPDYHNAISVINTACGNTSDAEVQVCYDASFADLYTPDGRYIMTCPRTRLAAKSWAEAVPGDEDALALAITRKNGMIKAATTFAEEVVASADVFKYGLMVADTSLKGNVKNTYNQTTEEALFEKINKTSQRKINKSIENDAIDQL